MPLAVHICHTLLDKFVIHHKLFCVTIVLITAAAAKEYEKLPRPIQARVFAIQERLWKWPAVAGAKPLRGDLAGRHRVRTGDYRVQFYVERSATGDYTVTIEKIGHRDRFYEE